MTYRATHHTAATGAMSYSRAIDGPQVVAVLPAASLSTLASRLTGTLSRFARRLRAPAAIDGAGRDSAGTAEADPGAVATPTAPDGARTPLGQLGRYELLEELGSGAMGRVFLALDPAIARTVAVKTLDLGVEPESSQEEETRANFLREAQAAGRLAHPDIVAIFDVGECDGTVYMAMEYVQGRRLSEHATPDQLLPARRVLELLARAADALHYAHARKVVHRDIKPANIMYDAASDALKITDFGVARLVDVSRTRTGIVLGTPAFMSPEQLEGENVNGHTDLFALGVSLYQLLTGRLPFDGASMTELMFVIANEPHAPVSSGRPGLPPFLNPVLDKALAKNPSHRYESGAAMAAALRETAARIP